MIVHFHKQFQKRYGRLNRPLQTKIDAAIARFRKNPLEVSLRNHALIGKLAGKRAFSVTGDMRIVFEEYQNYIVVYFLDVGTHNQVYSGGTYGSPTSSPRYARTRPPPFVSLGLGPTRPKPRFRKASSCCENPRFSNLGMKLKKIRM